MPPSLHLAHCSYTPTCRIIDLRVRKSLRKRNVHVSLRSTNCDRIACALHYAKQMHAIISSFLTQFVSKLNSFNQHQLFKNPPLQRLHHLRCCHIFWIFIQNCSNANDSVTSYPSFIVLHSVHLPLISCSPCPKFLTSAGQIQSYLKVAYLTQICTSLLTRQKVKLNVKFV